MIIILQPVYSGVTLLHIKIFDHNIYLGTCFPADACIGNLSDKRVFIALAEDVKLLLHKPRISSFVSETVRYLGTAHEMEPNTATAIVSSRDFFSLLKAF